MPYFLGIDIGTSQTKGVLVSTDGRIVSSAVSDHSVEEVRPGYFEQDPEAVWMNEIRNIISELKGKAGISETDIASAAISAMGPCVIPVGNDGRALRDAILYGIDVRAQEEIETLNGEFSEDYLIEHCGNTLTTQAAGPKILWIRNNEPEIFESAECFMTSTSYVVYRLTGNAVIDYYTACAGYTPLFDYSHMCWDERISERIGCKDRLPKLMWSSEIAGAVTESAAREFGLAAGTPVITGTCDAAAEAVSVGVFAPGRTMLMLGSTAFMISLSDKPDSDKRLWSAPFLFPGMYALIGGMGASGSITKWFLREMRSDMEQSMKSLDRIEEEAAMIKPGADGLLFLPYFCGERTPINDPAARGVFWGLTLHHTKDHLYRAVMEGIGFGILDNFTAMEECGGRIDEVRVVGGGTKSRIFPGLLCTISGKPFLESETMIGASYGDALMAMAASGFCSLKEIDSMIKPSKTIVPESETHVFYKSLFLKYKELWKTTKAICHFSS